MKYLARISGPLMDRIDVRVIVEPPTNGEVALGATDQGETSNQVAARVLSARDRQRTRLAGTPWRTNAEVPGPVIRKRWSLPLRTQEFFNAQFGRQEGGSVRGMDRTLRMAWTCADLNGNDAPTGDDLVLAMRLRDAGGRWVA